MKVILDECLPRGLARYIEGHEVSTVAAKGYSGLSNGRLLSAIEREFDAFVTIDGGIAYQQVLTGRIIRVIIVRSVSNRLEDLIPLCPRIVDALDSVDVGSLIRVG